MSLKVEASLQRKVGDAKTNPPLEWNVTNKVFLGTKSGRRISFEDVFTMTPLKPLNSNSIIVHKNNELNFFNATKTSVLKNGSSKIKTVRFNEVAYVLLENG